MMLHKGFTLIEVIIYIAILSFLIGSGVAAAFYIIDSEEKNKSDVNVESEAHFLVRKVEWALTGSSITFPASGASGDHLSVNKMGAGAITIDLASGRAQVNGTPITNDRVKIPTIVVDHIAAVGARPEAIHARFTINGATYETTKYIRK